MLVDGVLEFWHANAISDSREPDYIRNFYPKIRNQQRERHLTDSNSTFSFSLVDVEIRKL